MKRSEGLYMLPYAFNMRNPRLYQGWKVLEYSLEGETSWMSVHLIGYSRGRLCDCQHSTGRKERDNGEKPKSCISPLHPNSHPPQNHFQPPHQFSAPRGPLLVVTFLQAVMKSL